jgi:DNA uptake protein ComE-like DNA-binding protein
LVVVLWVLILAAVMAAGLQATVKTDMLVGDESENRIVAQWLARAAVEQAVTEISIDATSVDSHRDGWRDSPLVFEEIPLGRGTYSVYRGWEGGEPPILYGVVDESSKLNVNSATRDQLMQLKEMTPQIADAILDWRDRDENISADGAEDGYYQRRDYPHRARNGPFRTIRELLMVKDMDPELFYGEDTNLNGLLDINENDGDELPPLDNRDGRLDPGWAAWLTVYSYEKNVDGSGTRRVDLNEASEKDLTALELTPPQAQAIVAHRGGQQLQKVTDVLDVQLPNGRGQAVDIRSFRRIVDQISVSNEERLSGKVNVNTAPKAVLLLLDGIDESLADAIIANRQSASGPFSDIGGLLDVPGFNTERLKRIADAVTVRSNVFTILAEGVSDRGPLVAIEAVVDRGAERPSYLYWHQAGG